MTPDQRVLVVDDDVTVRRVVSTVLDAAGLHVLEAGSGAQALEVIAKGGLDLVVLDVMMPGLDGVEVCRRLDTDATSVLMLTAVDDEITRSACAEAGARGFLTKPFSAVELMDLVDAMLQR